MSENTPRRNSLSPLLWLVALTPMGLCSLVVLAAFALNLTTLRQGSQQVQALTRTRAALTSRAISFTSAARSQYTAQARNLTSTAVIKIFSEAEQYPLIFSDAFESDKQKWLTGNGTNGANKYDLNLRNGKYNWALTAGSAAYIQTTTFDFPTASKFYLSTEVKLLDSRTPVDYGLVFKRDDANYYYFALSNTAYRISARLNNQWRNFVSSKYSATIRPKDVNRLSVVGDGPNFWFYINGQLVEFWSDAQIRGTGFGFAAQVQTLNETLLLEFDDFELRAAPDTGLPTATPIPTNLPSPTFTRVPSRTPTAKTFP